MTIRSKVMSAMRREEWQTARQISEFINDMDASQVSNTISLLVRDDLAESRPTGHGKKREYKLLKSAPMERSSIPKFMKEHPDMTAREIADALKCRIGAVNDYIRNGQYSGLVKKTGQKNGFYSYSYFERDDSRFGRGNDLRIMFESLLKEVRYK